MQIQVCVGKSCSGKFSHYIINRLQNDAQFYKRKDMDITHCACMGKCKTSPNIRINDHTHEKISPAKASELINKANT